MNDGRIAKMTDNVTAEMTGDSVSHVRTAAVSPDEDVALANVDQAADAMMAAIKVFNDNLPQIKVGSVPEQAAVDAIKDLIDTAITPYFADILKAMQVFGK
jgi:hypothetical protein